MQWQVLVMGKQFIKKFNIMKTISLQDYAKIVGYKGSYPTTLEQIQDFVENELDCMLWDYPLEEADYCKEEDRKVVLVNTDFGLRLCEI